MLAFGRSLLSVVLLLIIVAPSVSQQRRTSQRARDCTFAQDLRYVKEAKDRAQLAVDYERVAKFKLASRKTTYRFGEMISVDLAILNVDSNPIFLMIPSSVVVRLLAYDANGNEVRVGEYFVYQLGISAEMYELVEPHGLVTGSLNLLIGCEERDAFVKAASELADKILESRPVSDFRLPNYEKFERNLFITWGDACLRIPRPGTYSIMAEIRNEHVVGSPCEPGVRTAVGTIRSTPLKISVIE